ncbi:hypothetical protein ACFSJQ_23660 [Vibrio olivae]
MPCEKKKKILQISDEKTIATFIKQLRKQATIDILDELTDGQYSKFASGDG